MITFSKNIYAEAFGLIGRGFAMAVKETGRVVNKAIHEWPYAFMFAEALVLVVIAFAYVGQARAERDYASKRFGISSGITINGETETEVDSRQMDELREYERQGFIQLRNKNFRIEF